MLASSVFIKTDLPEPVVPATKRWGDLLKSITSMLPDMSLPMHTGILCDAFLKLSLPSNSLIVTFSLFSFGIHRFPYSCLSPKNTKYRFKKFKILYVT